MTDADVALAVLKTKQEAHEKQCDERSERTADDIGAIRATMERESTERKGAVERIHERMDGVERTATATKTVVDGLQTKIDGLPQMIAEKISRADDKNKLWAYGKVAGMAVFMIGVLFKLFVHG